MLKLRQIMTTDLVSVTPSTTLRDTMELLARRHVSGVPVLAGDRLVGVVTADDLIGFAASSPGVPAEHEENAEPEWRDWNEAPLPEKSDTEDEPAAEFFTDLWEDAAADVAERMQEVEGPEWNALEEHEVGEVMTRRLWALGPDDTVERAAELMNRARIHRVLVVDGGRLVGIVTASDIARAVAERRVAERTYVFNRDQDFREPWS